MPVTNPLYDEFDLLYDEPIYTYDGFLPAQPAEYTTNVVSQQTSPGTYITQVEPQEPTYRQVPHVRV